MICRMIEGLLVTIVGGFIVEVLKFIIFRQKEKLCEKFDERSHSQQEKNRTELLIFNLVCCIDLFKISRLS